MSCCLSSWSNETRGGIYVGNCNQNKDAECVPSGTHSASFHVGNHSQRSVFDFLQMTQTLFQRLSKMLRLNSSMLLYGKLLPLLPVNAWASRQVLNIICSCNIHDVFKLAASCVVSAFLFILSIAHLFVWYAPKRTQPVELDQHCYVTMCVHPEERIQTATHKHSPCCLA